MASEQATEKKLIGFIAVCSNRPRPSVQKGAKGHQWWRREVHHIADGARETLCGRDASDWLAIDTPAHEAAVSANCCKQCAALAKAQS